MLISTPMLAVGWALAVVGIYYLAASLFGYTTNEENESLAAIWAFLFSFGTVSIAGIVAAKAQFASKSYVRQIYQYSIVVTAVLFLGYMLIGGIVPLLIDLAIGA